MKADNPEEAVDEFLGVPALEPEKAEWYGEIRTMLAIRDTDVWQGLQRSEASHQAGIQTQALRCREFVLSYLPLSCAS